MEKEFNIASELQKWVLGRTIANDMNASLASHGIISSGCPIFLYVMPGSLVEETAAAATTSVNDKQQVTKFLSKPNGNMSGNEADDVYETLRHDASSPMFEGGGSGPRPGPMMVPNFKAGQPITYIQNPLVSLNLSCENNVNFQQHFQLSAEGGADGSKFVATTSQQQQQPPQLVQVGELSNPLAVAQQSLIKNYYYQEGEVPFQGELVFEGLNIASNDLLPRVDEVDEEELDDDDEDDEEDEDDDEDVITTKDLNGPAVNATTATTSTGKQQQQQSTTYNKLIELEDAKCVTNIEPFECPVCFGHFKEGQGVVLRECLHTFCR